MLLAPVLTLVAFLALALSDLIALIAPKKQLQPARIPATGAASIVIPNWNGRDLLEKYLPSVVAAAAGNPDNEILVVDNASTDGSAAFVRERFPQVRVLELERNFGFGGGSNAGVRAARNDVVVLLNSDMRVEPGFLAPLLDGFTDASVFAVSCQIFFSDPARRREETGLAQGWWENGGLRVGHREDPEVTSLFPCFYGGGGSCAFDRRKLLELGGFDRIYHPFYLEDTDLGYMAWKRGWKVLYQPLSIVYHEHRGTIGKRFSERHIQGVLKKNFLLFCWKNIHEWSRLAPHLLFTAAGVVFTAFFGDSPEQANLRGLWKAVLQLPRAMAARRRARALAAVAYRGQRSAIAKPPTYASRHPTDPHRHGRPPIEMVVWPHSPALLWAPRYNPSPMKTPAPTPVPSRATIPFVAPRPAPNHISAWPIALALFSTRMGALNSLANISASGTSLQPNAFA